MSEMLYIRPDRNSINVKKIDTPNLNSMYDSQLF